METLTTVKINQKRMKDFRDSCKGAGLMWRNQLDMAIDKAARDLRQQSIKAATRKGKGAL